MTSVRADLTFVLRFVLRTGLLTACAIVCFFSFGMINEGGITGILFGMLAGVPFAVVAAIPSVPAAFLITLPIVLVFVFWARRLGGSTRVARYIGGVSSTIVWAFGLYVLKSRLPSNQLRGGDDPIPVASIPELLADVLGSYGFLSVPAGVLVCLRMARFNE